MGIEGCFGVYEYVGSVGVCWGCMGALGVKKGKAFYGHEPPSGESTTIQCGFNYQLLAVSY